MPEPTSAKAIHKMTSSHIQKVNIVSAADDDDSSLSVYVASLNAQQTTSLRLTRTKIMSRAKIMGQGHFNGYLVLRHRSSLCPARGIFNQSFRARLLILLLAIFPQSVVPLCLRV